MQWILYLERSLQGATQHFIILAIAAISLKPYLKLSYIAHPYLSNNNLYHPFGYSEDFIIDHLTNAYNNPIKHVGIITPILQSKKAEAEI